MSTSQFDDLIQDALSQPPLAYSYMDLSNKYGFTDEQIRSAVGRHNRRTKDDNLKVYIRDARYKNLLSNPKTENSKKRPKRKLDTTNILVIGDLHEPFCLDGYLDFCKETYKRFNCTHTILIGDEIDNHAGSFHDSDPDGFSAGEELDLAIGRLASWHEAFPNADVILGNHTVIPNRKTFGSGLSSRWLRDLSDVLETPTWEFHINRTYDDVFYVHGLGVTARTKAQRLGLSVVQGHRHTEGYVWHHPNKNSSIWGMQVGCGIDNNAYAFEYAKDYQPPMISVGVVLDNGKLPILVPMD